MEEDQKSCRSKREREKLIFLLLLIECNKACLKGCSGPGPEACAECAKGYKREEEGGPCEGKYTLFKYPSMYLPPPLSLFSLLQILMSVMMRLLLLIAVVVLIVLINQDPINVKVND